ncbi:hypothetical protein AML91_00115, partial [Paenibacillus jilunlii]
MGEEDEYKPTSASAGSGISERYQRRLTLLASLLSTTMVIDPWTHLTLAVRLCRWLRVDALKIYPST